MPSVMCTMEFMFHKTRKNTASEALTSHHFGCKCPFVLSVPEAQGAFGCFPAPNTLLAGSRFSLCPLFLLPSLCDSSRGSLHGLGEVSPDTMASPVPHGFCGIYSWGCVVHICTTIYCYLTLPTFPNSLPPSFLPSLFPTFPSSLSLSL